MTAHIHQKLIERWAADTSLAILINRNIAGDPKFNAFKDQFVPCRAIDLTWSERFDYYLVVKKHLTVATEWINAKGKKKVQYSVDRNFTQDGETEWADFEEGEKIHFFALTEYRIKPADPHAAMREEFCQSVEGTFAILWRQRGKLPWQGGYVAAWLNCNEYKLVARRHADIALRHANGEEVEVFSVLSGGGNWISAPDDTFYKDFEYRIKPTFIEIWVGKHKTIANHYCFAKPLEHAPKQKPAVIEKYDTCSWSLLQFSLEDAVTVVK